MSYVVQIGQAIWTWLGTAGVSQFIAKAAITYGLTSLAQKALARDPSGSDLQSEGARRLTTVRASAEHRRVVYGQMRLGGLMSYAETHGDDNKYLNLIVTLTGHEVEAIDSILWGDTTLTFAGDDGDATNASLQHPEGYGPLVFMSKNLGADAQTADGNLTGVSATWGSTHRQRGCAYLYARLHAEQERLNGIDNITAIVRGKKVYDPRTTTTVYSNNAALAVGDFLMDTRYGFGIPLADIDDSAWIAAANVCDENVSLNGGGTEKRYTANGTFTSDVPRGKVLQDLATAMAGIVVWSGGKYFINAGAYTAPTVTLTDDHLRGGLQVKPVDSVSEAVNRVRGIYANPDANYQIDDFPAVVNATYLSEDNGEEHWRDIELPFTTSAATAQRLAKIDLERSRQEIVVQFPAQLHGLQLRAGDTVAVDNTKMGWTGKVFDVLEVTPVDDGGYLGVDLLLKETASTVFDWNSGEETVVDPAPNTNLPDPTTIAPPTGLAVTSGTAELIAKGDGTIMSRAKLSWTKPIGEFHQRIRIQYKKNADADWLDHGLIDSKAEVYWIPDLIDGVSYDFRVQAVSGIGVHSTFDTVTAHTLVGKSETPALPTGLAVKAGVGKIHVSFTFPSDLDLSGVIVQWDTVNTFDDDQTQTRVKGGPGEAGIYEITQKWASAELVALTSGQTIYVRAKSVDTTGNESAWTSTVSAVPAYGDIEIPDFSAWGVVGGSADFTYKANINRTGAAENGSIRILGNKYTDPVDGTVYAKTPAYEVKMYDYGPGPLGVLPFWICHLKLDEANTLWPAGSFPNPSDNYMVPVLYAFDSASGTSKYFMVDDTGALEELPTGNDYALIASCVIDGTGIVTKVAPLTTAPEKPLELELEFPTVTAMKAYDFTTVPDQSKVRWKGFSSVNDGGAGNGVWDTASTDTEDDIVVMNAPTPSTGRILIDHGDCINLKKCGAAGDVVGGSGTDDSAIIQAVVDYARANKIAVSIPGGCYGISSDIDFGADCIITGGLIHSGNFTDDVPTNEIGTTLRWIGGSPPTVACVTANLDGSSGYMASLQLRRIRIDANGEENAAKFCGMNDNCCLEDFEVANYSRIGLELDETSTGIYTHASHFIRMRYIGLAGSKGLQLTKRVRQCTFEIGGIDNPAVTTAANDTGVKIMNGSYGNVFTSYRAENCALGYDIGEGGNCPGNLFISCDSGNPESHPDDTLNTVKLTGATWSGGVATYTTRITQQLAPGDLVTITGMTPSGYNVTDAAVVSTPTARTFTVAIVSDPGTATVFGNVAYDNYSKSVTLDVLSASWLSNVATYELETRHRIEVGDLITITGMTPSGYNVSDEAVTAITDTTVSVAMLSDPGTATVLGEATFKAAIAIMIRDHATSTNGYHFLGFRVDEGTDFVLFDEENRKFLRGDGVANGPTPAMTIYRGQVQDGVGAEVYTDTNVMRRPTQIQLSTQGVVLEVNSATPSVYGRTQWNIVNTSDTTITNFLGGGQGDEIELFCNDEYTTIAHNSNISLKGRTAVKPGLASVIRFRRRATNWVELSRSGTYDQLITDRIIRASEILTLTPDANQPSVAQGYLFTTASTVNTAITQFTNPTFYQEIEVHIGDALTRFTHSTSAINLAGSVNTSYGDTGAVYKFRYIGGGKWYEISRSIP